MTDGDEMRVFTHVEVDRDEMPVAFELSGIPVSAKRRLFSFIRDQLQTRHQHMGADFVDAMLASLRDRGCYLNRGHSNHQRLRSGQLHAPRRARVQPQRSLADRVYRARSVCLLVGPRHWRPGLQRIGQTHAKEPRHRDSRPGALTSSRSADQLPRRFAADRSPLPFAIQAATHAQPFRH